MPTVAANATPPGAVATSGQPWLVIGLFASLFIILGLLGLISVKLG
jgi:hypothetical protein